MQAATHTKSYDSIMNRIKYKRYTVYTETSWIILGIDTDIREK